MRQFHLLLAEWRYEQMITERRFYWLFCSWRETPPEPGAMFPFLDDSASDAPDVELDDDIMFQQAAAALGAV